MRGESVGSMKRGGRSGTGCAPPRWSRRGPPTVSSSRPSCKRGLDRLREQSLEEQGAADHRGAWLARLAPAASTGGARLPTATFVTTGGLALKLAALVLGLVTVGLAIFFVADLDSADDALRGEERHATPLAPLEAAMPPATTTRRPGRRSLPDSPSRSSCG